MAPKTSATTSKRKSAPGGKVMSQSPVKKAKLQADLVKRPKKAKQIESSEESSSSDDDSDDGGVALGSDNDEMDVEEKIQKASNSSAKDNNNQTSRERHEEQKRLAKERKLAKPLGEQLHGLKKIWERLRRKSHVPKEERETLVKELFEITTGHFKDLVMKHDAVRVVQTALKYSSKVQRKNIASELVGSYTFIASGKYSKFLIDKLLAFNDDEIRDLIVPEFYGHVRKMMLNPDSSWVLDDIYRKVSSPTQKAMILREWYGPEFAIFKTADGENPTATLSEVLEKDPNKRGPIKKSLMELIRPMVSKGWTAFTSLHDAMLQYFRSLTPGSDEFKSFFELCVNDDSADLIKHLAFTDSGSRLACLLLAYGTAKERKLILKAYKDEIQTMSVDAFAHSVILTTYETVDDTKLLSASVFAQIITPADKDNKHETTYLAANDLYARTTLLYIFEGASKSMFPDALARDIEILNEIIEIRKTTSKKDPEARRAELVKTASKPLIAAVEELALDLVTTSFGCQFITDVLFNAIGHKEAAVAAVAAAAAGDTSDPVHLSHVPFTGRMFKTLVQGGRYNKKEKKIVPIDPPLGFADALYEHLGEQAVEWASGPSSFVVLSMLESEGFGEVERLKKKLLGERKRLEEAAVEETKEQRERREAEANGDASGGGKDGKDRDGKGGKKKAKKGKKRAEVGEVVVGNTGTKLILKNLDM